jgi:tetratricopeptide (TPR) repeat protein
LRKTGDITPLRAALEWIDAVFRGDPNDVRTWTRLLPLASHAQAVTSHADARQITEPTSRLMNELAQLLKATNRLSEAEPLMRRVMGIFEKSFGDNHPNVAPALNNLAALLLATNRLAEAEPLMRRALAIDERSFGPEHPEVATALNNLAQLLQATNRLAEAEPLMRRVVEIFENFERTNGYQHPQCEAVKRNLQSIALIRRRIGEG